MMKLSLLGSGLLLTALLLNGCGPSAAPDKAGESVFRYGTTAYGVAMDNAGMDPHESYKGWSTLRYGVGETLFRFNEAMQPQPWLATGYEFLDDHTVKITLRDDVNFSSGARLTGTAVKACLEDLVKRHKRAADDLKLASITADGQTVTIKSQEKVPALINYLCDPYGCIIDMQRGTADDVKISGTGPYIVQSLTPTEIVLTKNPAYWGGRVKTDKVIVRSIPDGDTLTMALQNGEIDATQGLPYASLPLFTNSEKFKVASANTSRVFQACLNFTTPALQEPAVRKAIAMAIDKDKFTSVLLNGNGTPAVGPFPANMPCGGDAVHTDAYNAEQAKKLLREAGWIDTDGNGYVDKNGQDLTVRWLTYTSRQELPLLAEAAQAFLKEVGIRAEVNATDNYNDFLKRGDWDIYAKAFVAAPTGDPQYYFTTHVLDSSSYNSGHYHNERVEELTRQLRGEFDPAARSRLAVQISQQLLDDNAFIYASHLKMSFVMKSNIKGFTAHPSDYYEITSDLEV